MRVHYPLEILLPIAKLARSTFFYHQQPKPDKDSELKAQIREIKRKEPNYGYRRVTAKLEGVNHKRVQRLIQTMGLANSPRICYKETLKRTVRMKNGLRISRNLA